MFSNECHQLGRKGGEGGEGGREGGRERRKGGEGGREGGEGGKGGREGGEGEMKEGKEENIIMAVPCLICVPAAHQLQPGSVQHPRVAPPVPDGQHPLAALYGTGVRGDTGNRVPRSTT